VSEEEQHNILKQFEKKETEYMRLQRHKMSVDDFDLLTMIGKGAFGEVKCRAFSILSLSFYHSNCCKFSF
jgi:serine/threonine kinase 38